MRPQRERAERALRPARGRRRRPVARERGAAAATLARSPAHAPGRRPARPVVDQPCGRRRRAEDPERPAGDALVHLLDQPPAGGERLAGQLADRFDVGPAHQPSLQRLARVLQLIPLRRIRQPAPRRCCILPPCPWHSGLRGRRTAPGPAEVPRAGRIDMSALADELGVNRVTLYRWVGSRDRLLVEVVWSLARETLADRGRAVAARGRADGRRRDPLPRGGDRQPGHAALAGRGGRARDAAAHPPRDRVSSPD